MTPLLTAVSTEHSPSDFAAKNSPPKIRRRTFAAPGRIFHPTLAVID
jgi:hypothetical protein